MIKRSQSTLRRTRRDARRDARRVRCGEHGGTQQGRRDERGGDE
eukprot:gene20684-biopygen1055